MEFPASTSLDQNMDEFMQNGYWTNYGYDQTGLFGYSDFS